MDIITKLGDLGVYQSNQRKIHIQGHRNKEDCVLMMEAETGVMELQTKEFTAHLLTTEARRCAWSRTHTHL